MHKILEGELYTMHKIFNKSQYDNEYAKTHYDRINLQVPKGRKEIINQHRIKLGYDSLNAYINALIDKDLSVGGGAE